MEFIGARPIPRLTQLANIHGKLYGFRQKRICPNSTKRIPARDIFRFPNFFSRTGKQKVPDFIIEIVSPQNPADDYVRKLYYYKNC